MDTTVSRQFWPAADRETLFLVVGDIGLIALLVFVGIVDHGGDPIGAPVSALETLLPFVLGWLVIAPIAGAYSAGITATVAHTARVTAVAWIAAANVGLILRSSPLFHGGSGWMFNLVMTGIGLVVLVGWRVGYVTITRSS